MVLSDFYPYLLLRVPFLFRLTRLTNVTLEVRISQVLDLSLCLTCDYLSSFTAFTYVSDWVSPMNSWTEKRVLYTILSQFDSVFYKEINRTRKERNEFTREKVLILRVSW